MHFACQLVVEGYEYRGVGSQEERSMDDRTAGVNSSPGNLPLDVSGRKE
jgi:hypothetical protein